MEPSKTAKRISAAVFILLFVGSVALSHQGWYIPDVPCMTWASRVFFILGVVLFVCAVAVELKNQPQNYSFQRSKAKYVLQWAGLAAIALGLFFRMSMKNYAIETGGALGLAGYFGAKSLGYLFAKIPDYRPNSKEMKAWRRSPKR